MDAELPVVLDFGEGGGRVAFTVNGFDRGNDGATILMLGTTDHQGDVVEGNGLEAVSVERWRRDLERLAEVERGTVLFSDYDGTVSVAVDMQPEGGAVFSQRAGAGWQRSRA